jgi:hypothetical protein
MIQEKEVSATMKAASLIASFGENFTSSVMEHLKLVANAARMLAEAAAPAPAPAPDPSDPSESVAAVADAVADADADDAAAADADREEKAESDPARARDRELNSQQRLQLQLQQGQMTEAQELGKCLREAFQLEKYRDISHEVEMGEQAAAAAELEDELEDQDQDQRHRHRAVRVRHTGERWTRAEVGMLRVAHIKHGRKYAAMSNDPAFLGQFGGRDTAQIRSKCRILDRKEAVAKQKQEVIRALSGRLKVAMS